MDYLRQECVNIWWNWKGGIHYELLPPTKAINLELPPTADEIQARKGKDRSGRPKIYEDAELEKFLEEDSSQTQKQLALTLKVTQQAVTRRLKSLGMIHKQDNWVPYELKPKDVER
ncbi:Mariner Mos1 transposase [Eumeta japonica]|uniref:Mariner Mos1 transposase n=1 Tax=Eumeta variegata TaxID=151549 RepID=A0A4C1S8A9_EUMVA|nr:Mariner Mos1 transposase [Eumeta japonica]